ncbi:unnamed protein product [Urochloa decumbens]|uniref:Microsomal glutathione S-transferase 3 n=1 Tax=Urochloa decumbens TaxID=240449 RepID=A0ABC8YLF2_9POAL
MTLYKANESLSLTTKFWSSSSNFFKKTNFTLAVGQSVPLPLSLSIPPGLLPIEQTEEAGKQLARSHGGVDRAAQGVRLRGAGARGLRLPQLLDELPGRQGPEEVQGVLPHLVRRRVGEQGRQALQLRPEGAPELAGDDAALLRRAASGGLRHPGAAAVLGALYTVARFFYFKGYATGDPRNRMKIGVRLSALAGVGLICCTASFGISLVVRETQTL